MNQEIKNRVSELFNAVNGYIAGLHDRWQDEKEYENWSDYEQAITKRVEDTAEDLVMDIDIKKISKRPFGITLYYDGWEIAMTATMKLIKWRAKPA